MDRVSASASDLWPGRFVLSCAAAILFAGYAAAVLLPSGIGARKMAPAPEAGMVER